MPTPVYLLSPHFLTSHPSTSTSCVLHSSPPSQPCVCISIPSASAASCASVRDLCGTLGDHHHHESRCAGCALIKTPSIITPHRHMPSSHPFSPPSALLIHPLILFLTTIDWVQVVAQHSTAHARAHVEAVLCTTHSILLLPAMLCVPAAAHTHP